MQRIHIEGRTNLLVVANEAHWSSELTNLHFGATLSGRFPSFVAGPAGPDAPGTPGPFAANIVEGRGTVALGGTAYEVAAIGMGVRTVVTEDGPLDFGGIEVSIVPADRTSPVAWERRLFVGAPGAVALFQELERQTAEPFTPDSFTAAVLVALAQRYPDDRFEVVGPLELRYTRNGEDGMLSLIDTWKAGGDDTQRLERLIEDRVNLLADRPAPGRASLVAQVQHRGNAAHHAAVMGEILTEDLAGDAVLVYAIDHPHAIETLVAEDLPKLGVERGELRSLAATNLVALHPLIRIAGIPGQTHFLVVCGGNYEASMVLVPELWAAIDPHLEGERVVAIPNRDLLLVADGARPEQVARLREIVAETYSQGAYPVVDHLLVHRDQRWLRMS